MKWIKLYDSFSEVNYIKNNLQEIFYDISDDGLSTMVCGYRPGRDSKFGKRREHFNLHLMSEDESNKLSWEDVRPVIHRAIDFMDSEGWIPSFIIDFGKDAISVENKSIEDILNYLDNEFSISGFRSVCDKDFYWKLESLIIDFIRQEYTGLKTNEDVEVNLDNMRLSGEFPAKFSIEFINTISQFCLEIGDDHDVKVYLAKYLKSGRTGSPIPSCCVNIKDKYYFWQNSPIEQSSINWQQLETTIKEIQSYIDDFEFKLDIGVPDEDVYITAEEFFNSYNSNSKLESVTILIY